MLSHDATENINPELAKQIADVEQGVRDSIGLAGTKLNDRDIQALLEILSNPHLLALLFCLNQIGDAGAQAIAARLQDAPQLQVLVLIDNRIRDAGAQAIATALQYVPQLLWLDLSDNQIGAKGTWGIVTALQYVPQLLWFDLSNNHIGTTGKKRGIIASLKDMPQLRALFSYDNHGDAGAQQVLATRLKDVPQLRRFNLSYDHIGVTGTQAIAVRLQYPPRLLWFNLSGNQIGDEGAQAIASALKDAPQLLSLDLHDNPIGTTGYKALLDSLRYHDSLTSLGHDDVTDASIKESFDRLLQRNDILADIKTLCADKEYSTAQETLTPLLTDYPDDPMVLYWQGCVHQGLGDIATAHACFTRTLTLSSSAPAWFIEKVNHRIDALFADTYRQGTAHYDQQAWREAQICFEEILLIAPDYKEANDYRDKCITALRAQSVEERLHATQAQLDALQQQLTEQAAHSQQQLAEHATDNKEDLHIALQHVTTDFRNLLDNAHDKYQTALVAQANKLSDADARTQAQIAMLQQQLKTITTTMADLTASDAQHTQRLSVLETEKTLLQQRLTALTEKVDEHAIVQRQLEKTVAHMEDTLTQVQQEYGLALAQQEQTLRTMEADISALSTQLTRQTAQIEDMLVTSAQSPLQIASLRAELTQLEYQLDDLKAEQQHKQQQLDNERLLEADLRLIAFYQTLQAQLSASLLAHHALQGGLLERSKGLINKVIGVTGEVAIDSLLPGVGKVMSEVVNYGYEKYTGQAEKEERIASFVTTISGIEKVAQQTAWLMTQRFERQIRFLSDADVAKELATCAITRILCGLSDDHFAELVATTESLSEQLVLVASRVEIKQGLGGLRNTHLATLRHDTKHPWTESGVFTKTGIYDVQDDVYYHTTDSKQALSRADKYNYRLGTAAEAQAIVPEIESKTTAFHSAVSSALGHALLLSTLPTPPAQAASVGISSATAASAALFSPPLALARYQQIQQVAEENKALRKRIEVLEAQVRQQANRRPA